MSETSVDRVVLVVLDGFGVGAMPDAAAYRPADAHAFTFRSIMEADARLRLPELEKLGIGNVAPGAGLAPAGAPEAAYGRMALAHWGADTYAGHNELLGSRPLKPESALFATVALEVAVALASAGHRVRTAIPSGQALLVDDAVLVGDNLEADPGLIYNVTGALAVTPFPEIVAIGKIVRGIVKTSRVIALGGTDIGVSDILALTKTNEHGQTGVDSPSLHIYNEGYCVRHLGYGVTPSGQAPSLLAAAGLPVTLIGKMADVIDCPAARLMPCVRTPVVFQQLAQAIADQPTGLIAVTVQEADLAGHEQNLRKQAVVLALADAGIRETRARLGPRDLLIIAADHGNDPLIGHPFHTREEVPLLVAGASVTPTDLGRRRTMADVAATICDCFNVAPPEAGVSFARDLGLPGR
jgi:phosphopentomutase